MRADLWTCQQCGRQFANRNQPHSCGAFTVEQFLTPHAPEARALFDRFAVLALSCGDVRLAPARTRVGFQARMIFAAVNHLGPNRLDAHIVLTRRIENTRFRRIDEITPRCFVHHFSVRQAAELDDEVLEWLREGYEVGEQRQYNSPPRTQRRKRQ